MMMMMRAWALVMAVMVMVLGASSSAHAHEVVELTDESFDRLVPKGKWLVKFYAPWCGHCKRLAPVLREVAKKHFKGKINIGQVDVTKYSEMKSRFSITGFPTLEYFEDGEIAAPFTGGRDVETIAAFGARMTIPLVQKFSSASALEKWLEQNTSERDVTKEPLSFVLVKGTEQSDESISESLAKAAKTLRPTFLFGSAESGETTAWICKKVTVECPPKEGGLLIRYERGESARVFTGDLTDTTSVVEWVREVAVPVFTELGMHNYGTLARQRGKLLILGVYNPNNDLEKIKFTETLREIARGNSELSEEARSRFIFTSINGRKWAAFVENYNIVAADLPRILVIDSENDVYYEDKQLERDLVAFLTGIANGTVSSHRGGIMLTFRQLWRSFKDGLPYSALLGGIVVLIAVLFFYMLCSDDGEMEFEEELKEQEGEPKVARTAPVKDAVSKKAD